MRGEESSHVFPNANFIFSKFVKSLPASPGSRFARLGTYPRRVPLLAAAFSGIAGIITVDREMWSAAAGILVALLAASFLCLHRTRPLAVIGWGCLLAIILLGWRHHERLSGIARFPLASALASGQIVEISGEGWVADTVVPGVRSAATTLQLDKIVVGSIEMPCDHRTPTWIQKPTEGLSYGSRVQFTGRLLALEGPSGPGGFNAKDFYFRQSGSLAKLEIRDGDIFAILPGTSGSELVSFARHLRSKLEAGLLAGIPKADEPYARLIAAMALGARENSPEELEELFRISGTLHLFAVSGMHVGVVAGLLLGIALLLRLPRHYAVLVVIPLILFYALLTGLSPSAVRAALMLSAFLAAYALREKPRLLNSLGFACLFILFFDSQQLFLPGFQLSFAVVFFIALLTRGIHTFIARPFLADPFIPKSLVTPLRFSLDKATGALAASFAISLASWIGSFGLLAWHFHSVSMVALVANVFMVPFAGVIISLAALSLAGLGLKLIWITIASNKVNVGIAMALTGLAQFFAAWPGASLNIGEIGKQTPGSHTLRLDVMGDRGEGAMLLSIPHAPGDTPLHWMIDSGGSRTYRNQVLPLLRSSGLNQLDALILTHGDQGHIGAAPDILSQFRPALLLESVTENRSPAYPEIAATAKALAIRTIAMDRGHRLTIREGATCTVLSPLSTSPGRLADDRALVLKLNFADRSILLTSDAGFDTEKELLESGADLRADVWIRGQHSETPSGLSDFIEAVNPRAVISSHAEFPASERIPEALRKLLSERQIPLFDLAMSGTVTVEIEKNSIRLVPFRGPGMTLSPPP